MYSRRIKKPCHSKIRQPSTDAEKTKAKAKLLMSLLVRANKVQASEWGFFWSKTEKLFTESFNFHSQYLTPISPPIMLGNRMLPTVRENIIQWTSYSFLVKEGMEGKASISPAIIIEVFSPWLSDKKVQRSVIRREYRGAEEQLRKCDRKQPCRSLRKWPSQSTTHFQVRPTLCRHRLGISRKLQQSLW